MAASFPLSSDRSKDNGARKPVPTGCRGWLLPVSQPARCKAGGTASRLSTQRSLAAGARLRAQAAGGTSAAGKGTQKGSALSKQPGRQHPAEAAAAAAARSEQGLLQ